MKKVTTLVLMLCFTLSGAFCYAHGEARTKNEKVCGTPIEVIERSSHSHSEKGNAIIPTIDSHVLLVVFTENLGQVHVEVASASGGDVETMAIYTPNGVNVYIPNTGSYIVTFTLPNGDEYYGEFEVTD